MTFEERMAELGVDLSDLPKHKRIPMLVINRKISEWKGELIDNPLDLYRFILHLTDIIDRMETRLVNVTGERDYLFKRASSADILYCVDCIYNEEDCNDRCYVGTSFEYGLWAGVPEDWSVDE